MNEKEIRRAADRLLQLGEAADDDVKAEREMKALTLALGAQALVDLHRIADAAEAIAAAERARGDGKAPRQIIRTD